MAQGSVTRRGKVWYLSYPFQTPEGVYKRKWERAVALGFSNTQRGAEQALTQRLGEVNRGLTPASGKATVGEWVTQFVESRHVKPTTRHMYRDRARCYIVPYLGDVPLRDLTRTRVRQWHRALLERQPRPLSPGTIGNAHGILSSALREAVIEGLVQANVAAAVKPPSVPRAEPNVWTPEQLGAFLRAAEGDDLRALWLLCGVAGLRRGEALTLRWDDVDWQLRRVIIRRTYTRNLDGQFVVGTSTKTKDSAAPVDVPASCMDALREHRDRQAFMARNRLWRDQGYVFAREDGAPLHPGVADRRLARLTQAAGVPRITMQGLRHTAATFAFARGEHPKTVQAMLRHSRIGMTLDVYTSYLPTMGRESADRADAALKDMQG